MGHGLELWKVTIQHSKLRPEGLVSSLSPPPYLGRVAKGTGKFRTPAAPPSHASPRKSRRASERKRRPGPRYNPMNVQSVVLAMNRIRYVRVLAS